MNCFYNIFPIEGDGYWLLLFLHILIAYEAELVRLFAHFKRVFTVLFSLLMKIEQKFCFVPGFEFSGICSNDNAFTTRPSAVVSNIIRSRIKHHDTSLIYHYICIAVLHLRCGIYRLTK